MHGYLFQGWTTLTADGSIGEIVQDESGWLDLGLSSDLVLWTEVRGVRGSTNIDLYAQSAPSKDQALFSDLGRVPLVASPEPSITKLLRVLDPAIPLGRWLRWKLIPHGGSTTPWGATFRVHCAANSLHGQRR